MSGKGYLLRCLDGEAKGDYIAQFGWPLPERVVWFPASKTFVDFDAKSQTTGKPMVWPIADLHLTVYKKVAESELPSEVDETKQVMRGAQYQEAPVTL